MEALEAPPDEPTTAHRLVHFVQHREETRDGSAERLDGRVAVDDETQPIHRFAQG